MKAAEWASDRTKEAFEKVAKDEARNVSTVQKIMIISTDYLRHIFAPAGVQGGVTMSHLCPHCNSFPLQTTFGGSQEKQAYKLVCAICGEKYEWKEPNRLVVVQACEGVNHAKVFKAHAVPQGLCGNLINALKLLVNPRGWRPPHTEDRDEPLRGEQEGSHREFEKLRTS